MLTLDLKDRITSFGDKEDACFKKEIVRKPLCKESDNEQKQGYRELPELQGQDVYAWSRYPGNGDAGRLRAAKLQREAGCWIAGPRRTWCRDLYHIRRVTY